MIEAPGEVRRITPGELDARLRRGEPVAILDVRRREAWSADPSRVPGALWVPLEEVPERARPWPLDTPLVVYCD